MLIYIKNAENDIQFITILQSQMRLFYDKIYTIMIDNNFTHAYICVYNFQQYFRLCKSLNHNRR